MKIINTKTGKTVATILTNHTMTLDEAIELVGKFFVPEDECYLHVMINGKDYYYEDLALYID